MLCIELTHLITIVSESLMEVVTAVHTLKSKTGDNQDGDLEKSREEMAEYLHFLMSAIVGPIVCFFGLTGNLLSIITWARLGMGGSTGRYLTGQVGFICVWFLKLICI
jgi:hypothetical protein